MCVISIKFNKYKCKEILVVYRPNYSHMQCYVNDSFSFHETVVQPVAYVVFFLVWNDANGDWCKTSRLKHAEK